LLANGIERESRELSQRPAVRLESGIMPMNEPASAKDLRVAAWRTSSHEVSALAGFTR